MRKNVQQSKGEAVLLSGIVAVLTAAILALIYHLISNRGDND